MLSHLASAVRRRPLLTFVALSYALSWWMWPLYAAGLVPVPVAAFGPFLAALVVLQLTQGRVGVVALLRRVVRWRLAPGWYAAAFLIPTAIAVTATGLNVLLGAQAPWWAALAGLPSLLPAFLLYLLVPGFGGAWEEPGWRGYALQSPLARHPAWVANVLLWAIIVLWHLPLFLTGEVGWADSLAMIGSVLVYNWLYRGSGGSVLLVMLVHATNNAVSGGFLSPLFTGADAERLGLVRAALWCAAGLAVALAARAGRSPVPPEVEDVAGAADGPGRPRPAGAGLAARRP